MNRRDQVLKNDDLLLGKSSDGYLKDGKAAVNEERQTDNKISEGKLEIHEIECDEKSYRS